MMHPIGQDAELVLARCRTAIARLRRLRLLEHDIEEVGIHLRRGWITAAGARVWLRSNGVFDEVFPEQAEFYDTGQAHG